MPASIIIPAHNEAELISACLRRLTLVPSDWEIVVVCNACSDDTAELARGFSRVTVVETSRPGKMPALDLGDSVATLFPRLYVDADAVVEVAALKSLAHALSSDDRALVGSPALRIDITNSTRWVRIYFAVWSRLRYASEAIGSGVYGLSAGARRRFDTFPERGGDDQLVYRLFTADERVITEPPFIYVAPRTLRALTRSRARMFALNAELERTVDLPPQPEQGWRTQGLEQVMRSSPRSFARGLVFVGVQVVVRLWGRRLAQAESIPWHQDRTSRQAAIPVE